MRSLRILLVEDNRADAILFQRALRRMSPAAELEVYGTGEEAVVATQQATFPYDVVVTDINLPGMNGIDVLAKLEASPFAPVPAMVMSSSSAAKDVDAAYRNRCCGYVVKPHYVGGYDEIAGQLMEWWLVAENTASDAACTSLAHSLSKLPLARSNMN